MEQKKSFHFKAHGFGLSSGISAFYFYIICIVPMFLVLFAVNALEYAFPFLAEHIWATALLYSILPILLIVYFFASFHTVTLDEKEIRLLWLHIPIIKIPVSKLRLFCAVGNGRDDVLCLTSNSIEEMALWQEQKLLKNHFTRSDVPFIKKKGDWQDVLAKQYLNGLRRGPWGIFKDREVIFLEMQPILQYMILSQYPQLPYKNYTEIRPGCPRYLLPPNMVPGFPLQVSTYYAAMQEGGIHISTKKKLILHIPVQSIKTVVRVDLFTGSNDITRYYMPILFISTQAAAELAEKAPQRIFGASADTFSDDPVLLAWAYAFRAVTHWTVKRQDCCPLPCTQANITQLRTLCPQAEWIDLSDSWIKEHMK